MRAPKLAVFSLVAALVPISAMAECRAPNYLAAQPAIRLEAPEPPPPNLRPSLPTCLKGYSARGGHSCSQDIFDSYFADLNAYVAELNAYNRAAQEFANASARAANEMIEQAEAARTFAESAIAFSHCEANDLTQQHQ